MIVLIAKYHVRDGHVEDVLQHLTAMKPLVEANEPGCAFYQVSRSEDDKNLVLLYEHYTDESALAAHRETPHFQEIIEGKVIPLLHQRQRELYTLVIS